MPGAEATIYLIRHAEKPDQGVSGVDESGAQDGKSLIPRGWRRAGAWTVYFEPGGLVPSPRRVYAADDEKEKLGKDDKVGSSSRRPMETVSELAHRLGLGNPDTSFTKGQEEALADKLKGLDGVTLVCWQHEAIPQISTLLAGPGAGVPANWPGDRFDVVWRLRRAGGGTAWSFDQLCPQLLSGDLAAPIAPGAA
jgi:hypothetical protein